MLRMSVKWYIHKYINIKIVNVCVDRIFSIYTYYYYYIKKVLIEKHKSNLYTIYKEEKVLSIINTVFVFHLNSVHYYNFFFENYYYVLLLKKKDF